MQSTASAKRKNDAVITVCQNNHDNIVQIKGLNQAAERLTGYLNSELLQKNLEIILPQKVRETLESYLEFEEVGNDLASVLRKVAQFCIVNKEGEEVPVSLKVFYVIASHPEKPQFELLMRDISLSQKIENLKQQIEDNHQDREISESSGGLADADSVYRNLTLIHEFVCDNSFETSFAIMRVDNLAALEKKHKSSIRTIIAKRINDIAQLSLREADILGSLGDDNIGLALFDCNSEDAKVVLNRLRMTIESTPIALSNDSSDKSSYISVTVSIGFMQVAAEVSIDEMLEQCDNALKKAEDAGGNRIYSA